MAAPRYVYPQTYDALNDHIKAYTDETTIFERFDTVGAVGHARRADLEVGEALIRILQPQAKIVELEFYADRLSSLRSIKQPPGCSLMTFVGRIAFSGRPFKLHIIEPLVIMLHCGNSFKPISFDFEFQQGLSMQITLDPAQRSVDHRCWAVTVQPDGSYEIQSLSDDLSVHFDAPSIVDLIKDDGKLASIGHDTYNDNLRKLLDYQLLLASVLQDRDPAAAYELALFVLQICEGIPKALEYYARASALTASRVAGDNNALASVVPKLDLSIAQQVLDARLQAAESFDIAFRELQSQDANAKNIRLLATVALEASVDSEQTYAFIADLASQRFYAAQESLAKSQKEFQLLQLTLADRQKAFKDGIETWKTKNVLKAIGEGLFAVAAIAGSIAVACIAPPAGAAGIAAGAAGVGKAVEGVATAAEQIGRIAKIIEVIKNIYNKLKPRLEKIDKLVSALGTIIKLTSTLKTIDITMEKTIKSISMPSSRGDDTVNLTADWDSFQAEMDKLKDAIAEEDIDGAPEFFLTITQMVIRGKAILAAQSAVTTTGDAFLIVLTQRITQQRHTDRLRAAIPQIQGSPSILRLIKLTMAERLLALRVWITLDFKQYLAAYAWHALDSRRHIICDPMKELGAFRADAAMLQTLIAQVGSRVRPQSRIFRFLFKSRNLESPSQSLSAGTEIISLSKDEDFIAALKKDRKAVFAVNIEHPTFARYARVRTTGFRIFLHNPRNPGRSHAIVGLRIILGEQMRDLSFAPNTDSQGTIHIANMQEKSRIQHFVTTESVFGFEYVADTKEVLMDGILTGEHKTSALSPFRTWTVHAEGDVSLEDVDGLELELKCDVTYI